MKIKNFLCEFEKFAPKNLALSFDNIGLLIGDLEAYMFRWMLMMMLLKKQNNLI